MFDATRFTATPRHAEVYKLRRWLEYRISLRRLVTRIERMRGRAPSTELRSRPMPANDRWAQEDVLEAARKPTYDELEIAPGMTLTHTGSNTIGSVAGFSQRDRVVLVDESGRRKVFKAHDGAFTYKGRRVALRQPATKPQQATRFTASGSVDTGPTRARVARASRIWVEGIHDAELIEKIWGDDLRECGIVVEPLHGANDLSNRVQDFRPSQSRRLGILLDHLVPGSKESRIADSIKDPYVLVRGHPYVDIWAAVSPSAVGITDWPDVPSGQPWKEGVVAALGSSSDPASFWRSVLGGVSSYRDVETPLVNAVEQLIDFVTGG